MSFFNSIPPDLRKPLNARQSKEYYERFSLLTLKHFYPFASANLELKDAPDLQDKNSSYGVEVTRAVLRDMAHIDGEHGNYRLGDKTGQDYNKLERVVQGYGGALSLLGGCITYPSITSSDELAIIRSAIEGKSSKIASYQSKGFNNLGLFVNYDSPLIPGTHSELETLLKSTVSTHCHGLNFIIICDTVELLCFDIANDRISMVPYPHDVWESISRRAFCIVRGINEALIIDS